MTSRTCLVAILSLGVPLVGGCGGEGEERYGTSGIADVAYTAGRGFNGSRQAFRGIGTTRDTTLEAMSSGDVRTLRFTHPEARGTFALDGSTVAVEYRDFTLDPPGVWIARSGKVEVLRADPDHVDVRTTKTTLVPHPTSPGSARGTMVLTARIAL